VSVPHASQHSDLNDAVEALQAKVGADSSAVSSSHDYKIAQLEAGATGGKILQVLQTTTTTSSTTTSSSFSDIANHNITITPSSVTSKILILVNAAVQIGGSDYLRLTVFRGGSASGTNLGGGLEGFGRLRAVTDPNAVYSICYLDSPATTSAITYNVAWRVGAAGGPATTNNATGAMSTMTVMEVGA
jgi:hypothetical protein